MGVRGRGRGTQKMSAFDDEYETWLEIRQCDSSCPHFDHINLCCWLITEKTRGLYTDVQEYDSCIHGFTEESS